MTGIAIGTNISSLRAQRQLGDASAQVSKVFERLSSGQRINRASDDAAGLAISTDLNTRTRVFTQALRNINDGQSLLAIADSTVEQLTNIVTRVRELSEQSANGTFSNTQRKSINDEAQALAKEYQRITQSASFNGTRLFDGSLANGLQLQLGYGSDGSILSSLGGKLGNGTFTTTTYLGVDDYSSEVASGDLNGDGILDIVTSVYGVATGSIAVRLGNTDGTFGTETIYAAEGSSSRAIALGDINGDGILDVASSGVQGGAGHVSIRLGRGDGTFGTLAEYSAEGTNSESVLLRDLNNDGNLDLVTAGVGAGAGRASVRLGNGNGTFNGITSYLMESGNTYSATLADLNNDGIQDLLTVGDGGGSGRLTVRLGVGDGTFGASTSYVNSSLNDYAVAVGDLNGDGILDVVTAGNNGSTAAAYIRLGTGSGSLSSATTFRTRNDYNSFTLSLGDFNGDGNLDLVTGGDRIPGGWLAVGLGSGNGTFSSIISATISGSETVYGSTVGDFNGDGVLDFILVGDSDTTVEKAFVYTSGTRDGISPMLNFSLSSQSDALQSMALLDRNLSSLAKQRGVIGAFQSRLISAANTVRTTAENYETAGARIVDADVAEESAALIRSQVLQQAATSVLAQANQGPALVLKLLGS